MTLADLLTDDDREALEDLRMNDESPMDIPCPEPVVLQWDNWRIPFAPESDEEGDGERQPTS